MYTRTLKTNCSVPDCHNPAEKEYKECLLCKNCYNACTYIDSLKERIEELEDMYEDLNLAGYDG